MIGKQLYLDDLDRALKRLSARTGQTEAEHVRAYVEQHAPAPDAVRSTG
jgi:predicted DNA-binding protein